MAAHWHGGNGGKGSRPRPFAVPLEKFDENMDRIFGNEEKEKLAEQKRKEKAEYFAKLEEETKARLAAADKKESK